MQGVAAYMNVYEITDLDYMPMPSLDSMVSYPSLLARPRWKSKSLPSKPCRTKSAIAEKAYITGGKTGEARKAN